MRIIKSTLLSILAISALTGCEQQVTHIVAKVENPYPLIEEAFLSHTSNYSESNVLTVFVEENVTLSVGVVYGGVNGDGTPLCGLSARSSLDGITARSDMVYSETYNKKDVRTCLPELDMLNFVSNFYRSHVKPQLDSPLYI